MLSPVHSATHARNGGLIGLAAVAIALGQDVAPFLGTIIPPILVCLQDPENRVRYHACESLYNVAKVCKGEILVHFNEIFDALSKLASDSEQSVKSGAELLDRLMKDIVSESAPNYVSIFPGNVNINPNLPPPKDEAYQTPKLQATMGLSSVAPLEKEEEKRAFSLARFIPLLEERIFVISPATRMHLVSWLMVLDSVPDLELVAWLPHFFEGLLKYLADDSVDVRLATEAVLGEFLREIREIALVQRTAEEERSRREAESLRKRGSKGTLQTVDDPDQVILDDQDEEDGDGEGGEADESYASPDGWRDDSGPLARGEGIYIDYESLVDILIANLHYQAMEWLLAFLDFAQDVVVRQTPKIIPAIFPNLASQHRTIKLAAHEINGCLYRVIQTLPLQVPEMSPPTASTVAHPQTSISLPSAIALSSLAGSPPIASNAINSSPAQIRKDGVEPPVINDPLEATSPASRPGPSQPSSAGPAITSIKSKTSQAVPIPEPVTPNNPEFPPIRGRSRPGSPVNHSTTAQVGTPMTPVEEIVDYDPFSVRETVDVLTLQFVSDHAETRIAALEWLLMLHLKAPTKILSRDSGTFPALLKTLSDPSDDVVKHDLQLLAQISASSEDSYFTSFMSNVLELFSTDRRLLETRGSLIIRQLCLHLNAERIFRTIAEILEKDDDLDFASMMVVKLNMILITSPELADFRRRLKNLDSRDGQMLFSSLYRSWCHNAVAVFALCLLAQAYEHASNLLQIFADLELTVPLLVQIDKLVMLIESPVFTNLRLQLLEPDKYPFLPKCLYGLLMILPQSSAFVSLRARLSVVYSSGYTSSQTKAVSGGTFSQAGTTRSKLVGKDEIKWIELLSHFRAVQNKHEKARRQLESGQMTSLSSAHFSSPSQTFISGPSSHLQQSAPIVSKNTLKKKIGSSRQGSHDGSGLGSGGKSVVGATNGPSPLNPRRGRDSTGGSIVGLGGAVASMNPGIVRGVSPPAGNTTKRKILSGIRRGNG
ncbi:hypothetical protein TREMEDRAFT_25835 [Tremella mesenterica DSM 1558]|uniref:uncharacterized protein n=1 Tax=Tremella mesenterica (strain ATCC 24925 / CBS 8224 / DSM 1558 / NBRC 9311 / NRRL Y-6157 / RJB 2259-6 / UBC 559-6) TaxID=578456 RepID=UPI0003F49172|nr:uncharacterized protein TREMEDRAFT_25835 [Tremella mesenterica DSM 1558]EIW73485.1 hypothetical protein TREMEDRAFT_25835 [Tremella mesenterica DSM 1558]